MLRNPVIVAVVLATLVAVSLGAGNDASGDNILKSIQKRIDKSMAKRADFTNNNIGTGTHVNTNNAGSSPSGQSFTNNNMGSGDHINTNTASGSSSGSTINNNLGSGDHVNTNVRRLVGRPSDDVVIGPGDVASKAPLDSKIKAIRDAIATLHKDQQNRMKRADITNNNMGAGDHVNNNMGAGDHVNNNMASSSTDTKKPSGGDTIVNKNRDISERADFTNNNMGSDTHVNNNGASQSSNMHMPIAANNNNNNNHDEEDDEDEPSMHQSSSSGSTFVNKNRDANEKVSKTERADFTNNNMGSGTHVNNNGGSSSGSSGQSFLNNNMGGSGGSGNSIWTAPNGDTFINSNGRDANMTMNKTMVSSDLSERPKREKIVMLNKAREKRADFTNNNVGPGDHVNNNNGGGSNGQSFFNNNMGGGTAINNNDGSNGQSFFNNNVGSNGQSFVNNNVGGSMAVDSNGIPLTSTTIVNNNGQQLTMVNTYRPVQVKQGSQTFIIGYYRYLNNRLQGATIWRSVTDRLGLNAMSFFPQNEVGGANLFNQVI